MDTIIALMVVVGIALIAVYLGFSAHARVDKTSEPDLEEED